MSKVETDTNSQCIHNKNKDKLSKWSKQLTNRETDNYIIDIKIYKK